MGVIETFQDIDPRNIKQINLICDLENRLSDVRFATNRLISHPEKLKKFVSPYISSSDKVSKDSSLEHALDIAYRYYTIGENRMRDSGDNYIVHPIQTAVITNELGMGVFQTIGALLHDVFENNPELYHRIIDDIYSKKLGDALQYVLPMTPPPYITNSRMKKEILQSNIIKAAETDPQKSLYGIRTAERITNLLTLDYMKPKDGRSPEVRKQGVLYDSKKNVIPLAIEFDKVSGAELKLHGYMLDLITRHETKSDTVSDMTCYSTQEMTFFQRARLALSAYI